MKVKKSKYSVVAVSGGFDPIHIGHIRYLKEAKAFGDKLVVILNNDNWLLKKKGYVFMPESERQEILASIGCVDEVVLSSHPKNPTDMSVCEDLVKLRPDIFAKGGDRNQDNIPEIKACESIGCKIVYDCGAGGKVQSSSWLTEKAISKVKDMEKSSAK